MRFFNHSSCPECGYRYPFWYTDRKYIIQRNVFTRPFYRCPRCGTFGKRSFVGPDAFWSWPIAIALFVGITISPQEVLFVKELRGEHPYLFFVTSLLLFVLVGFLFRLGTRIVPASQSELQSGPDACHVVASSFPIMAFYFAYGMLTGGWIRAAALLGSVAVILVPILLFARLYK